MDFFIKDLSDIDVKKIINRESVIIGLDVGDKTIGVAVSDRRIKIASALTAINRNNTNHDYDCLINTIKPYNPGLIIFGWPLQMNGLPSSQCEKILKFMKKLSEHIEIDFAKWDERFSTKIIDNIMIEADLSRKRRKQVIDKTAAVYILQGAIDFLNRRSLENFQ